MQRNIGLQNPKKQAIGKPVLKSVTSNTLGGFLQKAQRALLTVPWQVLQIAPTNTPGEFRLWALVSKIVDCKELN